MIKEFTKGVDKELEVTYVEAKATIESNFNYLDDCSEEAIELLEIKDKKQKEHVYDHVINANLYDTFKGFKKELKRILSL